MRSIVVLVLSAPVVLFLLPIHTKPSIAPNESLTFAEISQAEQLIVDLAPQSPSTLSVHTLTLNVSEFNLLTRYILDLLNLSAQWTAKISSSEDLLSASASWKLLSGWVPIYLNVHGKFLVQNNEIYLEKLQVGDIDLPDRWAAWLMRAIQTNFIESEPLLKDINEMLANIDSINIEGTETHVQLTWDPLLIGQISDQAQQLLISPQDRKRIVNHYLLINEIISTIPQDTRAISLNTLLNPLFASANERSAAGGDPIAENRTLFQTLAIYVNDEGIEKLIGVDLTYELPRARFIEVRLLRRQDLAQHLVSMAAITASIGAKLAQLASTTKEAYDARYRSGFSFSDLTANTVGVTIGSMATNNINSALEMQRRLANSQAESDYMPVVGNNRDGIPESDFTAIYNDRSSSEYQERLNEIEEMINSKPLFRDL